MSSAKSMWCEVTGPGSYGQTKMNFPKLTEIPIVQNSTCSNLEKNVPDRNLMHLIFGGNPNGIRPPGYYSKMQKTCVGRGQLNHIFIQEKGGFHRYLGQRFVTDV